ncbi:MAG: hypothetical protein ACE5GC_04810 [Acidimicrobiia bacterium]
MHEHERDLIMALAQGELDAEEAAAARIELTGCAECSAELDLQLAALEAIGAAPHVSLSELESARLHRSLRQSLDLVERPAPVPKRRFNLVAMLGTAAAVLLVVVLALPSLQNLGGSSDDATTALSAPEPTVQADRVAPATTAAAATTAAPATVAPPVAGAAEDDAVVESAPLEGTTSEFTAGSDTADEVPTAPTTTTVRAAGRRVLELGGAGDAELEKLRDAWVGQGGDADLTVTLLEPRYAAGFAPTEPYVACGEAGIGGVPGADDYVPLGIGAFEDEEAIFLGYLTEPIEDGVVIAHSISTCDELGRAP